MEIVRKDLRNFYSRNFEFWVFIVRVKINSQDLTLKLKLNGITYFCSNKLIRSDDLRRINRVSERVTLMAPCRPFAAQKADILKWRRLLRRRLLNKHACRSRSRDTYPYLDY
jgi:hypothetical protein